MELEKSFVIKKIVEKDYHVIGIYKFISYATFLEGNKNNKKVPKVCFNCNARFKPDDTTYLAMVYHDKNRLMCSVCANEIAKKLGLTGIKSVSGLKKQ